MIVLVSCSVLVQNGQNKLQREPDVMPTVKSLPDCFIFDFMNDNSSRVFMWIAICEASCMQESVWAPTENYICIQFSYSRKASHWNEAKSKKQHLVHLEAVYDVHTWILGRTKSLLAVRHIMWTWGANTIKSTSSRDLLQFWMQIYISMKLFERQASKLLDNLVFLSHLIFPPLII